LSSLRARIRNPHRKKTTHHETEAQRQSKDAGRSFETVARIFQLAMDYSGGRHEFTRRLPAEISLRSGSSLTIRSHAEKFNVSLKPGKLARPSF